MKFTMFALALSLASTFAHARDLYNFHDLGYSKNGQFYAFAESVEADGSGFKIANASVVEVASNKLVAHKHVVLEADNATEAQALSQAIADVGLKNYGISSTPSTGQILLSRSIYDRSNYTDVAFTTYFYRLYSLVIEPTQVPASQCLSESAELLKISLKSDKDSGNLDVVLQADSALPKSRECAHNYQVAQVSRQGDSLVVIVRYVTSGFEGGDEQHIAVTKKITLQ